MSSSKGRKKAGNPKIEIDIARVTEPNFVGREDISAAQALAMMRDRRSPGFNSEAEYSEWFVHEALPDLMRHITGCEMSRFAKEHRLQGGAARIDVIARAENGFQVGFELKAANRKNPQTARYALVSGIGQAMLYQDLLSVVNGTHVPVYLVSDIVVDDVAALLLRHGLLIGVIEANRDRVISMGGAYVQKGH